MLTASPNNRAPRPLDLALACAAALAIVAVPAWLFADFEASREQSVSESWRALAVGRAVRAAATPAAIADAVRAVKAGAPAGMQWAFSMTEGGTDDFGIATPALMVAVDRDGTAGEVPRDLGARVREAAGRVKTTKAESGQDGVCTDAGDGLYACGVARPGGGAAGAVYAPTPASLPWLPVALPPVVLALLAGLIASRLGTRRFAWVAAGLAAIVAAAGAFALDLAATATVADAAGLEQALAGTLGTAADALPSHAPALGVPFVLGIAIAAALMVGLLLWPAARLLSDLRDRPAIYAAIAPAMVGMVLLIFVPFFMGVYLAFLDNNRNFVGLANFADILFPSDVSDTNFYFTLGVTVLWTTLNVFLHVTIGLALALVLSDAKLRGKAIYRVLLIIPWAVPNYITALIWKWIFNTQYGPANAFLAAIGMAPVDWLGRSFLTNFGANLATNTWLGFPFMMIVSLGALQSIPADLYEAAQMDGAGRWQQFRHVTLPLLKPALFPAIILGTIWTFNMFNVVYLVSGGGPDNKTNILITEAYRAFRVLKNYGLAAAYSLIIFFILVAYTAVTNRITKAAENVYE